MPPCRRRRDPRESRSPWKTGRSFWGYKRSKLCPCSFGRANILIYVEEVAGVVLRLDRTQAIVVATISRAYAVFAFFHHEVDVCAARTVGVKRIVVFFRPVR